MPRKLHLAVAVGLALGTIGMAKAQTAANHGRTSSPVTRWQASLDAFAAADRERAPRPGGVLFVGSSSIRLWDDLETAFEGEPAVVKRGFGGSRLADCALFLDRLVLPYRPRLIVLYAGDNDLAEGATPEQVAASFDRFVAGVRAELPDTRIAYLSIKPSPLRSALLPLARETNALIAQRVRQGDNLDYIDVFSAMLDAQGRPRAELFGADSLHMNPKGYALWSSVIAPHLGAPAAIQSAAR